MLLWMIFGVVAGAAQPVQTLVNTRLSRSTGTPYSASMFSFLVGLVCLSMMTLGIFGPTFGLSNAGDAPWWAWTGGVLGVIFLTGNILLFPRLGAVQTVVLPITGQVLMGLAIDHGGWFHSPESALSITRVLGALMVLAGVLILVGMTTKSSLPTSGRKTHPISLWGWRVFGLFSGISLAMQSAINGYLGQVTDGALVATTVSFGVGAIALVVLNVALRWKPTLTAWKHEQQDPGATITSNPWWMWLGGIFGAFFVTVNTALVPLVGTGLAVVLTLLGSMSGSVVVDRVQGRKVTINQILGLILILLGVVVIRFV